MARTRTCSHPSMFHHVGQERIGPTTFKELCPHNWLCPTCGYGSGQYPDPCHDQPKKSQ